MKSKRVDRDAIRERDLQNLRWGMIAFAVVLMLCFIADRVTR